MIKCVPLSGVVSHSSQYIYTNSWFLSSFMSVQLCNEQHPLHDPPSVIGPESVLHAAAR